MYLHLTKFDKVTFPICIFFFIPVITFGSFYINGSEWIKTNCNISSILIEKQVEYNILLLKSKTWIEGKIYTKEFESNWQYILLLLY